MNSPQPFLVTSYGTKDSLLGIKSGRSTLWAVPGVRREMRKVMTGQPVWDKVKLPMGGSGQCQSPVPFSPGLYSHPRTCQPCKRAQLSFHVPCTACPELCPRSRRNPGAQGGVLGGEGGGLQFKSESSVTPRSPAL